MNAVMRVLHQRSHAIAIPNITTIIMIGNQTPWEHWRIVFVYLLPLCPAQPEQCSLAHYICVLPRITESTEITAEHVLHFLFSPSERGWETRTIGRCLPREEKSMHLLRRSSFPDFKYGVRGQCMLRTVRFSKETMHTSSLP